jgi:hypothetical protein
VSIEERRPALIVGAKRRLIVVHSNFFENHLLFGGEVFFAQGGAHDIAQQFHCLRLIFGQDGGVIDRALFAGKGVVVGPHLVELAVHIVGRAARGPFEHHVFEKMADSRDGVGFVAGAGLYKETKCGRIGRLVAFGDNFQAVVERRRLKLHERTCGCL